MQDFTTPPYQTPQSGSIPVVLSTEASFFQKIYFWMCGALFVSALTGYILSQSTAWMSFLSRGTIAVIFIIGIQLAIVLGINFLVNKVSANVIRLMFLAYAVSMGFTFSIVLLFYPSAAIAKAFFSSAGVYGVMAIFGLVTKRSLQPLGSFLLMGLIGIIIASIVNLILASPLMDFVICVIGVLVFAGLTAYDHQKLRVIFAGGFANPEIESKSVTIGALELYLDFVNLFLFLLRLFARR
ncbi:MAG: Bax inhibitor-1/YccA family protein [Deltaproteobacteria bacterium]|jgi:FtsH-binding integral membrane protein|nr:Bax inhibitor-1/YccA family protein [Deltaproteobacteria bacterium]